MRYTGRVFLVSLAAAALALAGACGGSKGSSGSQQADDVTGIMNGVLPADGPAQDGGTVTTADSSDAPTLDVQASASSYTHAALSGIVYNTLVTYKVGRDIKYGSTDLTGDLAESWSRSDDATTWTFNLRKGVKFQDIAPVSGREFTADDVVCTINRSQTTNGAPGRNLVNIVDHLSTPDPYTVVFNLKAPYVAFDQSLAQIFMEIVPCEGTRGDFDMATTAIGTGPFTLAKWDRNVQRTYTKNPNYFVPGEPHIDQLNVQIISDPTSLIANYRTGQIDQFGMNTESYIPQIKSTNPDAVIRAQMSLTGFEIAMNQAVKPFDDIRVRKAVAMAWDRKGVINLDYSVYNLGGAYPPTLDGGLTSEEADAAYPYDPAAAKALLADAGYPDGFSVQILATDGYGPVMVKEVQWLQDDLKKVGIDVTLNISDYATFITAFASKNYTMVWGYITGLGTPDEWLEQYWRSDGPRNWFNIKDSTLDSMIAAQPSILDPAARTKALHDIGDYIVNNVANPIVGGQANVPSITQPWVHNLYQSPAAGRYWSATVWVDDKSPSRKK
jgi:peptide/nickel transport system substrate-binding protein